MTNLTHLQKVIVADETGSNLNPFIKRIYRCQCTGEREIYIAYLNHKSAKDAAADFAARTDALSNGYPFLNSDIGAIAVTEICTGAIYRFQIKMKKTYLYYPEAV